LKDDRRIANPAPDVDDLAFIRLLHLSDSALPIGGMAHSFGLETLTERDMLTVDSLENFLRGYIEEAGVLEAVYCRAAHRCMDAAPETLPLRRWMEINDRLTALKPAREARAASGALGQRLLLLALAMDDMPALEEALDAARRAGTLVHHSTAFGLVAGALGLHEDRAALGYLHQSVAGLISACQRLLPLGQSAAARMLWNVKPLMSECSRRSESIILEEVCCFLPLLDCAGMEHPALHTRLFIS
jgi:urease accessory protein